MDRHLGDSAKKAGAFRAVRAVVFLFAPIIFGLVPLSAAPGGKPEQDRVGNPGLRHAPSSSNVPVPNERVTISLPVTTLSNATPVDTVFIQPVLTTNLDPNRKYVGFQGDFTFDERVITFSPPYMDAAGLTADGWSVAGNILPGPGPMRVLRISAYSPTLTSLNGTGVLYNLRMRRVSGISGTITGLDWRLYPNAFEFIDFNLNEIIPDQLDGVVTITGLGPTATPSPIPLPTPCVILSEGFDNIYTLVQDYWVFRNNSQPLGETIWFQGESSVFPPQSGGIDSYIGANFENGNGLATLSNWLLTPPLQMSDGAQLTFYTRTVAVRERPDRLQVRLSTNGSSSDVGTTATSVGDFTTLLLDINPDYSTTGYPNIWTQYTISLNGLGSRPIGRLALRYFVENAGPDGPNSNWIGIDSFRFTSCYDPTPTPPPASPTPTPGEICRAVITESTSQNIVTGNSVACVSPPGSHYHFDNSYWRAFNLLPITGGQAYLVTSVSFGIEVATANPSVGTQPVVVRLYQQTSGEFPEGERILIATAPVNLPDQVGTVFNVPVTALMPAGATELIMEVFTPSGQPPANNLFFIGSNADGQNGPSYLSTQSCEYPTPTDLSILGFPEMHLVFDVKGTCSIPTPTPPITHALNLSTRVRVGTGDDVGIAGFIITGPRSKLVLVRGIGPSLNNAGVSDALADPFLELHGPGSFPTISNDNWRDTQETAIMGTGIAPTNDSESAILGRLDPGAYTAILKGNGGITGVGVVEIYDLGQEPGTKLSNLSTRAMVGTSSDIVIGGFILGGGSTNDSIWVRGLGPSLTGSGVTNTLVNPKLALRNSNGSILASNDDWENGPPVALPPNNPLESAIQMPLSPGAYTVLLSGVNNGMGVGLLEIYDKGP